MKRITLLLIVGMLAWLTPIATPQASAAPLAPDLLTALDVDSTTLVSTDVVGDPLGVGLLDMPASQMPTQGSSAIIISTGLVSTAFNDPAIQSDDNLAGDAGVNGQDMTQVVLELRPPAAATCVGFDFVFASEEYPDFIGSQFNDIFTAELNESFFELDGNQVIAPNNFAFDPTGAPISVNTLFGFTQASELVYNGRSPAITALSPIETDLSSGTMKLILTVQDLGDSIYDSAVIVDNLRWLSGVSCDVTISALTDTDGDGLSDVWETEGIDYNGDGIPEVDLPAMGADPEHKDLFVEIDWMLKPPDFCVWIFCFGGQNFAPKQDALDDVIESFKDAPVSNPDGIDGITLHIDSGATSIMDPSTGATWGAASRANSVAHEEELGVFVGNDYDWTEFDAIKVANFEAIRRDVFHYALYADMLEDTSISGISRGIPGSDFIVTDGGWGGFTLTQERGTFQHEFGHNLDLWHGGGEGGTLQYDTSYESVMNYAFQMLGVPADNRTDYSAGAPYDDWSNLRFDGGSVGDLGDSAPQPALTPTDSLTIEEAMANNVVASDGDGLITAVGPTALFVGELGQTVAIDITNLGSVDADYSVVSSSAAIAGAGPVTVAAGTTLRVDLLVDATLLAVGPLPTTFELSGSAGLLSSDQLAIDVADLNDPATAALAASAFDTLRNNPPAGLDPLVAASSADVIAAAIFPPELCDGKAVTIDMRSNGGNGTGTAGDDVILGTSGDDQIDGLAGNDTVCAGAGDDQVTGGDGDDMLLGEDGKDIVRGNTGVDTIVGGPGDDRLLGGIEGDTISGGEGNDYVGGFGGADTIDGGPGNDFIFGGFGADIITGGGGDDQIFGLIGNDDIRGGAGNDELGGDRGHDTIKGGDGNDVIRGGNGDDTLDGQAGDDSVSGGRADDALTGGDGVDICVGNLQNVADTADATCETIFGVP